MANPEQDFVMKTIKSRDVHFVRFWFPDVLGRMKSFAVIPSELDNAFEEGMGFDGSCIAGFSGTAESDVVAYPEADTFQVLPWRPSNNAVARMFCTIQSPDGTPYPGDSRNVLRRVCRQAAEKGYVLNVGPEVEYFYFRDQNGTEPLDRGCSFDLTTLDNGSDLRRDTILTLEKMGIPVEYSHHEEGPSQHEIDLRFSDAMSMADAVMTYKMVVKEVAHNHGVFASFMPKPLTDAPGSGMHVHMSLFNPEGDNLFFDPADPDGNNLSPLAKHFMAGLLKYAPEFCLITNQNVNSYKRLTSRMEAPSQIAWSSMNRSTLVRVPAYKPNKEVACRVEIRNPDPAANPYLAFAAMLAAGLKGIEDELELPAPVDDLDLFQLDYRELKQRGIQTLPATLGEALERFEGSALMREVLGDHIFEYLLREKHREWEEYRSVVSDWELNRYLEEL
jgi:glutamine synthetase